MNPIHESWAEAIRALIIRAPKVTSCAGRVAQSPGGNLLERNGGGNGRLKFRPAILFLFAFLALDTGLISSRAGDLAPSESQLKAAFLLKFPNYVVWPEGAFAASNSPLIVGIFDSEDVAGEFSKMSEGKTVDGHPIQILRVNSIAQCRDCNILFLGSSAMRKLPEIIASLQGANVLTIGESDEFIDHGGMINLARHDRRIVLEVNLDATRQTQLKISSKLMALASVKGGKR